MWQFITSPDKFARAFNDKVAGAERRITADDVRLLTECGLIKKHGYYLQDDLQTVIGILNYEQRRLKTMERQDEKTSLEPPRCKLCSEPLPPQPEGKVGRPREYCQQCEALRRRERYRKWKKRRANSKATTLK